MRISVIQVLHSSKKKENSSVSFLPLPQDGFLPLMHGGQRNYLGLRSSKIRGSYGIVGNDRLFLPTIIPARDASLT